MKLLIVESPAKAKTISKYLDNKYTVTSSVGHIRDIPKSSKDAIDIEGGFIPHYEVVPGKEKVVQELKKLCKKADEVVLATDPDREGEAIAWHVAQACELDKLKTKSEKLKVKRIVFHEITKPAVQEAMEHPRDIDQNLRKAQEARRVLDRLVGYDLSGLIWKKVRYGLSAGRVQSPALRILMEKEREVRAFKSEDYWVITANTRVDADSTQTNAEELILTCVKEPREKKEVEQILSDGEKGTWTIKEVKETQMKRTSRAPFTTSTLQQAASSQLGFAPSRTMRTAQRLYEAGHITYMRTDSTTISPVAQKQALAVIKEKYGEKYADAHVYKTKSKAAQEAHEAVRPTNASKESAGATDEQERLYGLIWRRFISSQMADAQLLKTKITVEIDNGVIPDFAAHGSQTIFDGWLAADTSARGETVELPSVKEKEQVTLIKIEDEQKQTQPPGRYTEAGLIKELEKRGIGRPSTYASIIKTIIDRGYVTKDGRTLFPTDTGEVVSDFLEENFTKYISDTFTAEMENELDEIADGKREYQKTLSDFYTPFSKDVKSKESIEKITDLGAAPKEFPCPKCGKAMVIKLSKTGKFMSCGNFPDCSGARTIEGKELAGPKETGEACTKCKNGKLIEREGRFGKFIGCNNYPKCKFIKGDPEEEKKNQTDVKCPECGKGFLTARRGRFGEFYSCSEYPTCKFAIKAKPTGKTCPECNSLMMLGTKTIPERCSNKACSNHNPHKLKK
ncbi:DNA topoisomerase I [bacterium]|nr:DNA topoisomerase I [bacterium]|tara:strand:+ start:90316 stop:92526 length:2211 start_codon:yes stop_codon:yes gene_type:complete